MNLSEILIEIRAKTGADSERKLARELQISPSGARGLLHGRNLPSDETMLRIAYIIALPPEEALVLLNSWRAKGRARAIYGQLHKTLTENRPKENGAGKNRKHTPQSKGNKSPK